MQIAPAAVEDAPGIAAVHIRSWQRAYAGILDPGWLASLSIEARAQRWTAAIAAKASRIAVARQDGRVIAFTSFGPCRDNGAPATQGEIWALYAAPEVWGQGAGRALLEHAVAELGAEGFESTALWVLSANHRGIRFYEGCGFQRVPDSEKVFELGGRQVEELACVRRHGP